jgi:hypothetical protein
VVALAYAVMHGIDLDPMSDADANIVIGATRIFTVDDNAFDHPWEGRIFLNPSGELVREAWAYLMREYGAERVTEAIWTGFSLEQLQTLQSLHGEVEALPHDFPILYPRRRVAFVENEAMKDRRRAKHAAQNAKRQARGEKTTKFNERSSPSHASYIAYVGPHTRWFRSVASMYGKVVVPA